MTPEGRVKDRVKALLKKHGAYYHMPVQNGFGAPTLDIIGCHKGRFFAVETKAGRGDYTDRQRQTAENMATAGARVFLVNSHQGYDELQIWLAA
jgi:predicted RecB family endonuclease